MAMILTPEQQRDLDIAQAAAKAAAASNAPPQEKPAYSGAVLPLSKDSAGHVYFDSNAGLIGAIKRALTLPHDVATGQVDPLSNEGISRSLELGTLASPVNPAVRMGERAIPGVAKALRQPKMAPPTAEALKIAADAGYSGAREMGVEYSSDAIKSVAGALRTKLEQDGIIGELAPKTFSILKKLETPPENSTAPLSGIDAARRALGNAAKEFTNPTEQLAASRIIDGLDKFTENPPASAVVAGPAADAATVLSEARGNYAAAMRSDRITGAEDAADLAAAVANSGRNIDNALRQRAKSILLNPKQRAGFNSDEIAALEEVARGTATRNRIRDVGNLLGGGGGMGAVVTGGVGGLAGSHFGAPGVAVGAGLPLVGMGAKGVANALTRRALGRVDEMTRMRSPLYSKIQRDVPMSIVSPEKRAAIVRALLLSQSGQNQR